MEMFFHKVFLTLPIHEFTMFTSAASPGKNSNGEESRQALLQAATDEFLAMGYRAARVQNITRSAGLGLSAINYHFGGKEGLYRAVLSHHAEQAIARLPLNAPEQSDPQAQLRWLVSALLHRLSDPANPSRIGPLLLREMMNPTAAFELLFERFASPQFRIATAIVRTLLGERVPERVVAQSLYSLFGQCVLYITGRPMIERFTPEIQLDEAGLQQIADHITAFSWGGLQALRQRYQGESA